MASWGWKWRTRVDKRRCSVCAKLHGKVERDADSFKPSKPPVHPRCRCDILLALRHGAHTNTVPDVAHEIMLAAEQATRTLVWGAIRGTTVRATPAETVRRLTPELQKAILEGRKNAKAKGRAALALEVAQLAPLLDHALLLRHPKMRRSDSARASKAAKGMLKWYGLAVVALIETKGMTEYQAQVKALVLAKAKAETAIINETVDAFASERAGAIGEVRARPEASK
jgi:hypothetical protein